MICGSGGQRRSNTGNIYQLSVMYLRLSARGRPDGFLRLFWLLMTNYMGPTWQHRQHGESGGFLQVTFSQAGPSLGQG